MTTETNSFFEGGEDALRAELLAWQGTPFAHGGKLKGVGVDCVQLVGQVMQARAVLAGYDFGEYSLEWGQHSSRSMIVDYIERTGRCTLLPAGTVPLVGDIVCFKIGRCIQHCGIALDERRFLHVMAQGRVTINQLDDVTWARRLAAIYRVQP